MKIEITEIYNIINKYDKNNSLLELKNDIIHRENELIDESLDKLQKQIDESKESKCLTY